MTSDSSDNLSGFERRSGSLRPTNLPPETMAPLIYIVVRQKWWNKVINEWLDKSFIACVCARVCVCTRMILVTTEGQGFQFKHKTSVNHECIMPLTSPVRILISLQNVSLTAHLGCRNLRVLLETFEVFQILRVMWLHGTDLRYHVLYYQLKIYPRSESEAQITIQNCASHDVRYQMLRKNCGKPVDKPSICHHEE